MKHRARRRANPDRTEITTGGPKNAWLATLTDHAYTVILAGPRRVFAESSAPDTVTHRTWVRTLPVPFDGDVDTAWLERALDANERKIADILALALQYLKGAPRIMDGDLQIAGDAHYGPLIDGHREEGSDFNDYLGIEWTYPERVDKPEARQRQCLDCSGFVRMLWGYRRNMPGTQHPGVVPLSLDARRNRSAIPRRAHQIYEAAPGVVIVPDSGDQVRDFSRLGVGDLVFFDADDSDGTRIDHVGVYLGRDAGGHHRFVSSRKGADGPTLGDHKGKSVLDGTGLYARSFRAVRRL
jgi:hypothetical protein